jgi:hemerythrin
MNYEWCERYSFDDPVIDDEHRELLKLLRLLHDAGESQLDVVELLARLLIHAAGHFDDEEALMRTLEYPEADALRHNQAHRGFEQAVQRFAETVQSGRPVDQQSVQLFMDAWFAGHFLKEDMKLRDFARANALGEAARSQTMSLTRPASC